MARILGAWRSSSSCELMMVEAPTPLPVTPSTATRYWRPQPMPGAPFRLRADTTRRSSPGVASIDIGATGLTRVTSTFNNHDDLTATVFVPS